MAALQGASVTDLVWPASDVGTSVQTVDQHQDQGIHWSLQSDSGTVPWWNGNPQLPKLWTSTQVGNSLSTRSYRIDFVDPSDGSARSVQALALNIMTGLGSAFLRVKDASNQNILMTPKDGGGSRVDWTGTGFFGVIAESGEGLYGMVCGSTEGQPSRGDAVRYSLLVGGGGATTTTLAGGGAATTTQGGPHASGDPHLSNTLGEHFDVVRAGMHALLQVPRGEGPGRTLLHVDAKVTGVTGERCGALYIRRLRLSGSWAAAQNVTLIEAGPWPGARPGSKKLVRLALGPLRLGIEHRMDGRGFYYLSIWIGGLRHAGVSVGGLLGEDDHTWAASDPSCVHLPRGRSARGRAVLPGRGGALEASTELTAWGAQGPGGAADQGGSYMRATLADLHLDATKL